MPIQEKDLGKYKRSAIYIEEINNSIIELPAQNVLINLVPGFSKKGPVNRPVYVDNRIDFERIFGTVDRQLESKGSFFHRTVIKMLETGPVWALNLLRTLPNRDILNYASVSTSALYPNSDFTNLKTADYERFFNRQDFWERDSESFLDVVNDPTPDNDRLIHLTNMGDKKITTFIFKSTLRGFDITASQWYGGDVKVPEFIHPNDLISDYMVTVLVLSGDWTNYKDLSVSTTWSKYFTTNGLITENIQDFVNERNVITLGVYDVSLIPDFKDINDNDMFIENIINNNTDKTGLFCTYNRDIIQDKNGLTENIDLIGGTLVGLDVSNINFLSYNQSIKEDIEYSIKHLDSPNNTFGTTSFGNRTNVWNNWTQIGIENENFNSGTMLLSFDSGTYIINGVEYDMSALSMSNSVTISNVTVGNQRKDVIYLDSTGLNVMNGLENLSGETFINRSITFDNNNTIIIGTLELQNSGGTYIHSFDYITESSDLNTIGITATDETDHIKIEFLGTSGTTISNNEYFKLRLQKIYNEISTNLQLNKGVIINTDGLNKTEIIDINSLSYTSSNNSQIHIYVDTPADYINSGNILLYYIDDEFILSSNTNEFVTKYDSDVNVVAKYSKFYEDYFNGIISNGDYIDYLGTKIKINMYLNTNDILTVKIEEFINGSAGITVSSDIGNWKQTLEIEDLIIEDETNTVSIRINKDRYSEIKRNMYVEAYYDEDDTTTVHRKLTRIIDVKNDPDNTDFKIIYTDAPIAIKHIDGSSRLYTIVYPPVYQYVTTLKGVALKPFVIHQDSIPDGTENRQNNILNVISKNTSLYNGLVNKNKISWRYLIDSFGLGLTQNSKQQYLDLCGKKLNCFGFINMPSAKQFKKSINPSFVNDDGSLNTEYIKNGANEDKNPNFRYTFGQGVGRSTVGYFFPYVRVTEDNITRFVPPAANVATAYMRKFTTSASGVYPHTIVAGVNMGRIPDIASTEMDFTDNDLDNLSDMGCNPIMFIRNVGYIISEESTAEVFPVSSLSYIHSREVLIELENELYDMLLRYQWKFNTPGIRAEIKYRADMICQRYVDIDALYDYKNICDETNNTNYIIDLQGGVLDTHIEIIKGMGWIVNNITIEKTGGISSSGFQQ
ncbi:hypothetical protein [Trichloromonas sp.]|uniref:hypothetical protein n=1 Tax=Trichloromonas sp. TaxID=3069249 RepID=UPI002A3A0603|nr:hypothetical protein [Trichloromonas sp.]